MDIKGIIELHSDFLPKASPSIEDDIYYNLIKKYLFDRNVLNIALFGGYGSGKSRVIETYIDNSNPKEVCKVSLAKYNTNVHSIIQSDNDKENKYNKDIKYKNVYEEIIKQIFLSTPKSKVCRSKFNYLYKKLLSIKTISVITFGVLALLLIVSKFVPFTGLFAESYKKCFIRIYIVLLIASFCIVLYTIIDDNLINSLRVHNVSFDFKLYNENSNILDKYLSEIIYIFKKSDINVVFFEDLDRYNDIDIFVELRELNKAINLALKEKDKAVSFVYAIREDIFDNPYDKFKLFDASISIVPYESVYNSFDLLRNEFDKVQELFDIKINDELLNTLSYYVQEYRAIIAIVNDFIIFYNRLKAESQEINVNTNNLLYLIAYKNLFTIDFAKIYSHDSIIDRVLDGIKDNDKYKTINEVYNYCINEYANRNEVIKYINSLESFSKNSENSSYNDLLWFVLTGIFEGYLNDTFGDYVSYIFSISISEKDYNFITYIKDGNSNYRIDYDYTLDKPEEVVKRLHKSDFGNVKILNYSLLTYISKNFKDDENDTKINNLTNALNDSIDSNSDFIINCIENDENFKCLFKHIYDIEKISDLLHKCYERGTQYSLVFNMIFCLCDTLILKQINSSLQKYGILISDIIYKVNNEILFKNVGEKNIIDISNAFDIVYENIEKYDFDENVIEELYRSNRYIINKGNILYYMKLIEKLDLPDDDLLSYMELSKIPIIKQRVCSLNTDFQTYFDNVWENRNEFKEDDGSFLELLQNLQYDSERKKYLFDHINLKIRDVTLVNNSVILELLKRDKIEINENNVSHFANLGIQECNNYINDNIDIIAHLDMNDKEHRDTNKRIIKILEDENQKLNYIDKNVDSLDVDDVTAFLTNIDSDLMNEFSTKDEIMITEKSKIFSKILEKIGYIKIVADKRRTSFMKIERI